MAGEHVRDAKRATGNRAMVCKQNTVTLLENKTWQKTFYKKFVTITVIVDVSTFAM